MRCAFPGTLGKALRWYHPSQKNAWEFPHRVSSLLSPQRRGSIRGVSLDAGPVCVQQAQDPSHESPDNMVSQIVRQSKLGSKPFHTGCWTTVCIQSELTNLREFYFVWKWYNFWFFFNFHSQDSWGDKIKDMQIWAMFIFFLLKTSMCMKNTHNGTLVRKHETGWNKWC